MDSPLITSFVLGLLATTSPCVFPLYPGFLAYLSGERSTFKDSRGRYLLGFFVLAGVLVMMLALGGVIAALSISVGGLLAYLVPLSDFLIIGLGIALLFNRNPFSRLPQLQVPVLKHPFASAFVYGLLYGPIALPCSGPLVVSIFALSFTAAEAAGMLWIFFWFGLGFGLPLLLLSFAAGAAQRWITLQFARRGRLINFVAGVLLVAIGVGDLAVNWENLLAVFSA